MRKFLLPFAMTGLISLPLAACDVEDTEDGDTTIGDTNDTTGGDTDTTQPDTTPTTEYRAIIVDDDGFFQNHRENPCLTSSVGAHGADIDAVGLFESDGTTLVSYFETINAQLGTECEIGAAYSDPTEARGTPNGTLTANFVSLGGGAIIGEFVDAAQLLEDDVVVVYEIGDEFCGGVAQCVGDEPYHLYVADRLDCLDRNRSECSVRVTGTNGAEGEASIPLTGF